MVSIKDVRKSNATFKQSSQASGLVAVFVGATSGIGMGTLKQFAKQAQAPKVYVLGRSKKSAAPLLDEIKASDPEGDFQFIETEVSLMKNVDTACDQIKSQERKVDILFLTPGYLSFDNRLESTEGIDIPHALRYYTRLRFVHNLLPLLVQSPIPRVISVLAGGQESPIDLSDLEVKNDFTFIKAAKNGTTQTTLAFEELAKSYPTVTFIHKYPGFVNTGVVARLMETASGLYAIPATIVKFLLLPIVNLFSTTVDEAGERGLFLATSARYPPSEPTTTELGTALPPGVVTAKSSVEKDGVRNGVYRLGADDESVAAPGPEKVMAAYRAENAGKVVLEGTLATWDRALARST